MFTSHLSLWWSDQIKAKPLNTLYKTTAVLTLRPIIHVNKYVLGRSEICKRKKKVQENAKREFPLHYTSYLPRGFSQADQVLNLCQGQDATPPGSVLFRQALRDSVVLPLAACERQ